MAALSVLAAVLGVAASAAAAQEDAAQQGAAYADVPADAYFAEPVSALAARGVFAGTECDDGFCPSAPVDRKTMAVWIVRLLDGEDPPPVADSMFSDVDAAGLHGPFIERMAELEVTRGCGDGRGFCPDRSVTRAQMAAFLSRAYMLPEGPDPGFDDVPSDAWYAGHVARLAASGITVGCGDGTGFCPGLDTTRGQMATFLHRAETHDAGRGERALFAIPEGPRGDDTLISASRGRTCAVRLGGGVACWGRDGLRERFALAGLQDVVAVTTADNPQFNLHACALRTDGTVSCWGDGSDGKLGQGEASNHYLPVKVPGITDAVAVAAGGEHTCAVHRDGGVSCWGNNPYGVLGDRTTNPSYTPKRVPGLSDAASIAASRFSTCAVHRDGDVSCWGQTSSVPDADSGPRRFSAPEAVTSVSAGWDSNCSTSATGAVYCWRWSQTPAEATRQSLTDVAQVSVGAGVICALHRDGGVSCAGRNNHVGQIGDGTTAPRRQWARLAGVSDAVAVSVSKGTPAAEITGATPMSAHSCALHADGSASCWGGNEVGQVGDGTTVNRLIPTRVEPVVTIPADQAPLTPTDLLRTWAEAVVQQHEADYPWMRVAWDHIRDRAVAVQSGFGGQVWRHCYASGDELGCDVEEMHITSMTLRTFVHELLHVYDLNTGLAPPRAWGAVQLYFATTYPGCWAQGETDGAEILADTVNHLMLPGAWLTYYNSPGCPTLPQRSEPTAEAEQVVLQGLAGQVPDWYADNITNGAELWAAWLRGPSLPALANLAGEFGGLCSTDWITHPFDPQRFPPAGTNPFRDGGCPSAG